MWKHVHRHAHNTCLCVSCSSCRHSRSWSDLIRRHTGADFNEGGQFQFSDPDPQGMLATTNLFDRSFNEKSKADIWNGDAFSTFPCTSQTVGWHTHKPQIQITTLQLCHICAHAHTHVEHKSVDVCACADTAFSNLCVLFKFHVLFVSAGSSKTDPVDRSQVLHTKAYSAWMNSQ